MLVQASKLMLITCCIDKSFEYISYYKLFSLVLFLKIFIENHIWYKIIICMNILLFIYFNYFISILQYFAIIVLTVKQLF